MGCREHSYYAYQYPNRPGTNRMIDHFLHLRADVQAGRGICQGKPGKNKMRNVLFIFGGKCLTVPEILLAAFQQRYAG